MRCCADGVGIAADGVVVSSRLGEAAVGVCRPVFGESDPLAPKIMRSRSRFLGFLSDIFKDFAVKWMIRTVF